MGKPRKVDKSAIDTAAAENTGSDPATGESATAGSNNDQPLITHLLELRDQQPNFKQQIHRYRQ